MAWGQSIDGSQVRESVAEFEDVPSIVLKGAGNGFRCPPEIGEI